MDESYGGEMLRGLCGVRYEQRDNWYEKEYTSDEEWQRLWGIRKDLIDGEQCKGYGERQDLVIRIQQATNTPAGNRTLDIVPLVMSHYDNTLERTAKWRRLDSGKKVRMRSFVV